MKKFIKINLLLCFIFLTGFLQAQDVTITLTDINTLLVNQTSVNDLDKEKIKEMFGKPTQTKISQDNEDYLYEDLGLIISFEDNKVSAIGINYNWDGDEKFPKTSFKGTFSFGSEEISASSERDVFVSSEIIEMSCMAEVICMSKNKESNIKVIAAFKDNKVTQVTFRF